MVKVLITTVPFGDKDSRPLEHLKDNSIDYLINPIGRKLTEDELAEMVADFDIIIAGTEKISSKSREGILFVGNDSNRDFDLLLKIAEQYPDIKFTFVTKKYKFKKPNLDNVKFIDGSWGNQMISDEELKNLYKKSKITI